MVQLFVLFQDNKIDVMNYNMDDRTTADRKIVRILGDIQTGSDSVHDISTWVEGQKEWLLDFYVDIRYQCEAAGLPILDNGATFDLFCKMLAAMSSVSTTRSSRA